MDHQTLHVEEYQQEYGRAGRDGKASGSLLLWTAKLLQHASMEIRTYVNSEQCRRQQLMRLFDARVSVVEVAHSCCDVCAKTCSCNGDKPCRHQNIAGVIVNISEPQKCARNVHDQQGCELETRLLGYASSFGDGELVGFSVDSIQPLLQHAETIFSESDISVCVMLTANHTGKVLEIFHEIFGDCDREELS